MGRVNEDIEDQLPTFGRHSEVQNNLVGSNPYSNNRNRGVISLSPNKLPKKLKFDEK